MANLAGPALPALLKEVRAAVAKPRQGLEAFAAAAA